MSKQLPLFASEEEWKFKRHVGSDFSDYIVYVDESGDHGLGSIDKEYPMFVLAFCVFHKEYYCKTVVPKIQSLKFQHFGHDLIILHEREIRKETGDFRFKSKSDKNVFVSELTDIIDRTNFILISSSIKKHRIKDSEKSNQNLYHLALGFCLETLSDLLLEKNQHELTTHIVFEKRGKAEDNELELEFRRICDGDNRFGNKLPYKLVFGDKKVNSAGLQIADLVARPIGRKVLNPDQPNRAFDILETKFFCEGGRKQVGKGFLNWGHKIYPS